MSTDSLSSSPPQTRYFDLLPLELIRHIIEQLAPLEYDQKTYQDRRRSLCSTCLVSRLFRKLAQPLLFEVLYISSRDWLKDVLETGCSDSVKRLLGKTRMVTGHHIADIFEEDYGIEFLNLVSGLEDLRLTGSTLRNLHLTSMSESLILQGFVKLTLCWHRSQKAASLRCRVHQ